MIDRSGAGDYRPHGRFPGVRTACHRCRRVSWGLAWDAEAEVWRWQAGHQPGDGFLIRQRSAPGAPLDAALVAEPCQECGSSGWLDGLVPPL